MDDFDSPLDLDGDGDDAPLKCAYSLMKMVRRKVGIDRRAIAVAV